MFTHCWDLTFLGNLWTKRAEPCNLLLRYNQKIIVFWSSGAVGRQSSFLQAWREFMNSGCFSIQPFVLRSAAFYFLKRTTVGVCLPFLFLFFLSFFCSCPLSNHQQEHRFFLSLLFMTPRRVIETLPLSPLLAALPQAVCLN